MRKPRSRTALVVFLPLVALFASTRLLAQPPKAPNPGVAEGVRLHDQGRYDEAIAKYKEVLARDPDDFSALYELAFTYRAKKDRVAALETAKRGIALDDARRPQLYVIIGNLYDEMGKSADAIAAYRSGIRANPDVSLLHFNLGLAYLGREEWREGRRALQQAALLRPEHASTHYYLGYACEKESLKAPAFLAYVRFLLLEPDTARSRKVFDAIDGLFRLGYRKDAKTAAVTLTVSGEQPKEDEGDFTALELAMLVAQAAHEGIDESPATDPAAGKVPIEPAGPPPVDRIFVALEAADAYVNPDPKGFTETYYLPYFRGLKTGGFLQAASYLACQSAGPPEVTSWLKAQASKVEALRAWSASFKWTGPRKEP